MNLSGRSAVIAALVSTATLFAAAAPASADSVKIDLTGGNFAYFSGSTGGTGEMGVCAAGKYYGGHYDGGFGGGFYNGDANRCSAVSADNTYPQDALTTVGDTLGGVGQPPSGCDSQDSCEAMLQGLCAALTSGSPTCASDPGSGGGGDGGPAPPCTDEASCAALLGGGDAPAPRGCTSRSGGAATCIDFAEGNYLVLDSPDDGQGELGFCTNSDQAPEGPGYYFISGPNPDGGKDDACPAAASGGETSTPPAGAGGDGDGDGVPDDSDRCPTTAAGTADGCPAESDSGSSPGSGDGSQTSRESTTGSSQTTQRPAPPAERPRVDVMRQRLTVSRRWRVAVPLECQTVSTACVGDLRLTAVRRTPGGRRVRVLVAKGDYSIGSGRTVNRHLRLTKAGRRMMADRRGMRARVRTATDGPSGMVVRRERVILNRG